MMALEELDRLRERLRRGATRRASGAGKKLVVAAVPVSHSDASSRGRPPARASAHLINIGVEMGQAAIVALIFPLLLWSDRIGAPAAAPKERHPPVVYTCSAVIFALGLYRLMARTVFA